VERYGPGCNPDCDLMPIDVLTFLIQNEAGGSLLDVDHTKEVPVAKTGVLRAQARQTHLARLNRIAGAPERP